MVLGSFKCLLSYCIPFHMVCDHIFDCPDMEDEHHCDTLSTSGLLYCRYDHIYVHQRYICDGVIHCLLSQDDEALCETFHCPDFCICRGYAILCDDPRAHLTSEDIPTSVTALYLHKGNHEGLQNVMFKSNLIVLDIANSQLYNQVRTLPELFSKDKVRLRILDMSNSSLQYLKSGLFQSLHNLEHYNIQHNIIRYIPPHCFNGLSKLMSLNLYDLNIEKLNKLAFYGLHSVVILNLSSNSIKSLNRALFQPLRKLKMVDIKGNPFQSLELNLFAYAPAWIIVISTDNIQCCYMRTATQACIYEKSMVQTGCGSLLTTLMLVLYICGIVFIIFTTITSVIFQLKIAVRNAQVPLIISLSLNDLFSVIVLMYYIVINTMYSHNYSLWHPHITNSAVCKLIGGMILMIELFPKVMHVLMTAIYYRVTVHALETAPYSILRMVFYIIGGWVLVCTGSMIWSSFSLNYTWIVCVPFNKHVFAKTSILITSLILYVISHLLLLLFGVIGSTRMITYIQKSERRLGIIASRQLMSVTKRIVFINGLNVLLYVFEISTIACHLSLENIRHHIFATLLFLILVLRALINFILYTWQFVNLSQILQYVSNCVFQH